MGDRAEYAYWLINFNNKTGAVIFRNDSVTRFVPPIYAESEVANLIEKEYSNIAEKNLQPALVKKIHEYFEGKNVDFFDAAIDLTGYTEFQISVLNELRKIPWGETVTYSGLASKVGKLKAARAVGSVMRANRTPLLIPCHRVLAKNGLGGYSGGLHLKKKLLTLEGKSIYKI